MNIGETRTLTIEPERETERYSSVTIVKLRSRNKKKVEWKPGTLDNENMEKKSSKCVHLALL